MCINSLGPFFVAAKAFSSKPIDFVEERGASATIGQSTDVRRDPRMRFRPAPLYPIAEDVKQAYQGIAAKDRRVVMRITAPGVRHTAL